MQEKPHGDNKRFENTVIAGREDSKQGTTSVKASFSGNRIEAFTPKSQIVA